MNHLLKTSALAALLTLFGAYALATDTTEPFVVEGYEPLGAPRLITTGRYEEVIARSAGRLASARIDTATSTNLCVAYIKTARFDAARVACDAAIAAAVAGKSPQSAYWPRSEQGHWDDVARGYSNRAVLNWYSGARAAAEADLAKAATYAPKAHFVLRNATALQSRGSSDAEIAALAGR